MPIYRWIRRLLFGAPVALATAAADTLPPAAAASTTSPVTAVEGGTLDGLIARRDSVARVISVTGGEAVRRRDSSVVNALTGLGGDADKGATARPNLTRQPLTDAELAALYLNNGIARRIVDIIPAEATRKAWTVTADVEGERVEVDAAAAEDRRLAVVANVREAWSLARLWGHALIVLVTEDDVPAEFAEHPERWLEQPLDLARVKQVKALQVFDALESWPIAYDGDFESATFREPLIWGLAPSIPGVSSGRNAKGGKVPQRIHTSRVLHFRGRGRPPSLRHSTGHVVAGGLSFGGTRSPDDSALRAVWDEIRNLSQTMAGGATLAQELRESVLKIAGLRAMATADQAAEVQARLGLMAKAKSLLGMIVLGENDEYDNRSNPPTGFRELSSEAQSMLSAVTGIPLTILFGQAPAGLTSDDKAGRESWDNVVSDEQGGIAPHLVRLYNAIFAATEGVSGGTAPVSVRPKFRPLHEASEAEQAATYKTTTEADAILLDRGVVSAEQVAGRFTADGYQTDLQPAAEGDDDDLDLDLAAEEAKAEEVKAADPTAPTEPEAEPIATEAGELPPDTKVADVTYNGAQIAQAVAIATGAFTGAMPRAEAVAQIVSLLNMPADKAEAMVPQLDPAKAAAREAAEAAALAPEVDDAAPPEADDAGEE